MGDELTARMLIGIPMVALAGAVITWRSTPRDQAHCRIGEQPPCYGDQNHRPETDGGASKQLVCTSLPWRDATRRTSRSDREVPVHTCSQEASKSTPIFGVPIK